MIDVNNFTSQIGNTNISKESIIKVFGIIRKKIMEYMNFIFGKNLLDVEIKAILRFPSVEIDERKIICQGNEIYWVFGIIDRNSKEAPIRCILNKRTKEKLIVIFNKYVTTDASEDFDLAENLSIKDRVYSDSFSSYQVNDFKIIDLF